GPDDAVGIVVLFDGGCDDAADADAVTAHDHCLFAAFLAEYLRAHGLAVLGAELEDVADLDTPSDFQGALAVRARIPAHHVADVLDAAWRAVAPPVDTGEMMAVAIGATGEIGEHCSGAVDNGGDGQVDGTDGADAAADGGFHFSLAGEGQGGRHAGEFFGFDVVEHVVASQHQRHQAAVLLALHDQGFHRALGTDAKVLADLVDGTNTRGGHFGQRLRVGRRGGQGRNRFGFFDIGGVAAAGGKGDVVLARIRQHMEFVGKAAADAAGVRQHGAEVEPQAGEDVAVGAVHEIVGLLQALLGEVEGVGILHDEFPRPHHAEAGADLVAELGLDLVEVGGQLLVAADLAADEVGDHFLVGGAEAEVTLVAVVDAQQFRPVLLPATGFDPEVGGLHHRHQDLLGAGLVHLLAHDVFHLAQHPEPQGQPGVEARRQFADHAGAEHQLVADHFGVRRGFLLGGDQESAGAHGSSWACRVVAGYFMSRPVPGIVLLPLIVGVPWRRRFAKETRMFVLDPQLHRDCVIVGRFPLSLLLLSRDANYPWFILGPQRPGIIDPYQLAREARAPLLDESCQLSEVLMDVFSGDKLNVAALGNVVAQLHVHHIVRHRGDRAWPRPVWGAVPAAEYSERAMADLLDNLLPMLAGKDF